MPGVGGQDRGQDPDRGRRRQQLPDRRPPRRLRRSRPRNPQFRVLDPRGTALQERKQAAQTGLLPLRVRRPRQPGLPGLLRQENRAGQAPHPSPALPRPTQGRRPVRDAPRRNLLRTAARCLSHLTYGAARRMTRSAATSKPSTGWP
jgi:hypothetical protein